MIVSHQPVMVDEVIRHLITDPEGIYVDGTVGTGGHSLEIGERLAPEGRLICLDVDSSSIEVARARLSLFGEKVKIRKCSYVDIDKVLQETGVERVDGILLDLGVSSYQLESSGRGFSFAKDEPLDMRMDQGEDVCARDLINNVSVEGLQRLLLDYAQERWAKRIARAIAEERQKRPISSSRQLASIVEAAIPAKHRPRKIHPATKTFQAMRVAVNRELQNVADFLDKAPLFLGRGGRLVVLSYHSLEDRLVKQAFVKWEKRDPFPRKLPVFADTGTPLMRAVRKRALRPRDDEVHANPRSRSAIMRVAERA
jgi:16S rRNA (cytosine1402-N4)-methyltransferase